ncbi:MAG TPA: GGDEF domain-containing protein [Thiopseudomonas sp.]|nr:GGDEF domain-containing protein [Thiopseudomonas sp.]
MEKESQSLSKQLEKQRQITLHDTLAELPNRAAWNERFALEHARIQRNGSPLTLGIIDLDHFKQINDSYGHLAGDKVLKTIAIELKKRLRRTDFIARIGGEEYVVLLPDTPLAKGYQVMEKLRLAIQNLPFHLKDQPVTITFSAGVGEVRADESMNDAFEHIDQTLYIAKNAGRNSVRSAEPLAADPTSMPTAENQTVIE